MYPTFLSPKFLSSFANKPVSFGYGSMSEFVYNNNYSRLKDDGQKEVWAETIERVVGGTMAMASNRFAEVNESVDLVPIAEEMYERMFEMKFLAPGRGLWAQGSKIITEKHLYPSLNNCAFVSTSAIQKEGSKPFCFLMDQLMLGLGVGFDTEGANKITIKQPGNTLRFVIPDTREGWVDSLRKLLDAYFYSDFLPLFDYSRIRPAGQPLTIFGGISSGPECLVELHTKVSDLLNNQIGKPISVTLIADICNLIGKVVISGNIRRSSEIALGPSTDEFIQLKDWKVNPGRSGWSWCSNNSVTVRDGDDVDYQKIIENVKVNGEPGIFWLDNARNYSRMNGIPDYKDHKVLGVNPCGEQSLESYEICCLVEIFPSRHDNYEDFLKTLTAAHYYAKTVTLGKSNWSESTEVIHRNRRIGCSLTGVVQFVERMGIETLKSWCEGGYRHLKDCDKILSDQFQIPMSIKLTTVKPSGTVSLLAGATPGICYPIANYYIRRVRISNNSPFIPKLKSLGYNVEADVNNKDITSVIEFPIAVSSSIPTTDKVDVEKKFELAALMQSFWSDNQVSTTVDFRADESDKLHSLILEYKDKLKSISFLQQFDYSSAPYPQMPYEPISEQTYGEIVSRIKKGSLTTIVDAVDVQFCDGDRCLV